jgi:hypothetical protein
MDTPFKGLSQLEPKAGWRTQASGEQELNLSWGGSTSRELRQEGLGSGKQKRDTEAQHQSMRE